MNQHAAHQQAADAVLAILPKHVKDRLRAVYMQHGRNRKAMRASNAIIKTALRDLQREKARREAQAVARKLHAGAQALRLAKRGWQTIAGMSAERWEELRALAMNGLIIEELAPEDEICE